MLEFGKVSFFIDFKKKEYTKTLDRVMGEIIRQAAREWLKGVLKSVPSRNGFPILTVAAKGSLAPLGRFLRVNMGDMSPKNDGRHEFINRVSDGQASQEFEILSRPPDTYSFRWSTDLEHYFINEYYGIIKSAPWHSMEAGERAMEEYVTAALQKRLPNLADRIGFRDG